MRSLLIDSDGKVWDAGSFELRVKLAAALDVDLAMFTVRNLGYVGLILFNDRSCRLRLRPACVSPVAFGTAAQLLSDMTVERVLVSTHDDGWSHQFHASAESAIASMATHVTKAIASSSGDYVRRPALPSAMPQDGPLSRLLALWNDCAGRCEQILDDARLGQILGHRFVLVRCDARDGQLLIDRVGKGLPEVASYWLSRSIGQRVEDQPDCIYGRWVADAYRDVLVTGRPLYENIEASIRWPRAGRRQHRYSRLILPLSSGRQEQGTRYLLGATAA